jgi:hypothetical protein
MSDEKVLKIIAAKKYMTISSTIHNWTFDGRFFAKLFIFFEQVIHSQSNSEQLMCFPNQKKIFSEQYLHVLKLKEAIRRIQCWFLPGELKEEFFINYFHI